MRGSRQEEDTLVLIVSMLIEAGWGDGRVAEDTAQNAHVDFVHHTDRGQGDAR